MFLSILCSALADIIRLRFLQSPPAFPSHLLQACCSPQSVFKLAGPLQAKRLINLQMCHKIEVNSLAEGLEVGNGVTAPSPLFYLAKQQLCHRGKACPLSIFSSSKWQWVLLHSTQTSFCQFVLTTELTCKALALRESI